MSESKPKIRQSLLVTILDKKNVNLEAERQKALFEKQQLIEEFEKTFLRDESGKLKKTMKSKNYVDNSKYEGEFDNDKRTGIGLYHYANGDKFAGEWKDDRFDGVGHYIFANGERFDGELREGVKCGQGSYHYVNGNKYEGDWTNDKKNGKGVYYYFSTGEK